MQQIKRFFDSTFRGLGQVMFQNNAYTGAVFLVGILYNSLLFGAAAAVGAIVSTGAAYILQYNKDHIYAGFYGFNGALTSIALVLFFEPTYYIWGYVIIAAITSTVFMASLQTLFSRSKLPTLTAPFVFTTLIFLLAYAQLSKLHPTQALPQAHFIQKLALESSLSLDSFLKGTLNGVSQVFFQENLITAVLFLVGLLINSRPAFILAVVGSIVGYLTSLSFGANDGAMTAGLFGYNSALTAIALGSVFLKPQLKTYLITFFASIVTAIATAAISSAFAPLGMPAMTLPFVVVTWIFLLAHAISCENKA